MSTIEDYIKLRGDITILERDYNEIDFAALALLSYVDFSPVVDMESDVQSLKDVFIKMMEVNPEFDHSNKYNHLFELMHDQPRYENIGVRYYFQESDKSIVQQFGAVTFLLEDGRIVISFRGTDHSLIGWKENFLMLYQDSIPSEEKAIEYLNLIQVSYPLKEMLKDRKYGRNIIDRFNRYKAYKNDLPMIFTGHSKGGHLALYAGTIFQKEVYNYDGPGMNTLLEEYQSNQEKVHSYIPEYSLFGRFFTHYEPLNIVTSSEKGSNQHSIFTWNVLSSHFEQGSINEAATRSLDNLFQFLNELTNEEKKAFIDAMFMVFDTMNMKDLDDLKNINFHKILNGIDTIRKLDSKTRNNMIEMITILYNEFK